MASTSIPALDHNPGLNPPAQRHPPAAKPRAQRQPARNAGVLSELRTLPWSELHGRVAYIDPVLNPATRAARVRIELDNRDGVL